MEHPARVEEEREGGTGPRGRDRGGERPPGVAVWVAEGIIRVVLGVADSPCGCGVRVGTIQYVYRSVSIPYSTPVSCMVSPRRHH